MLKAEINQIVSELSEQRWQGRVEGVIFMGILCAIVGILNNF